MVVLDELDFEKSEKIINDKLSMGLLSCKTGDSHKSSSEESLFMTIATGRRVSIPNNTFKTIKKVKEKGVIEDYDEIKRSLDAKYSSFSKHIDFLGDTLKKNKKKTSYIGNSSESLIISDKNGEIDYWEKEVNYNIDWLKTNTEKMLNRSDVLLVSFNVNNSEERIRLLEEYLKSISRHNVMVFPKTVSGDMDYRLNSTIVPILYSENNNNVGILTSKSTKRLGVITNLDIFPTIISYYDINMSSSIGNEIEVVEKSNLLEKNKEIFKEFLNLNIIKYVFHGLLTVIQVYIVYSYLHKNKDRNKLKFLVAIIPMSILISLVLGLFHLHTSIVLYLTIVLGLSILLIPYLYSKNIRVVETLSVLTNVIILLGVFLKPSMLYNSFIGYNSIIAGGRFYGFNNEIMGVLMITSAITYFFVRDILKNSIISNIFLISYIPIVIISLSGRFGANFGGYLTSIALFLVLIYLSILNKKANKKSLLTLIAIGIGILCVNLYFDIRNDAGSHAGKLLERVRLLGYYEFIDMIIKKLKQLIYMTIVPPWCIIFISQIYFMIKKFRQIERSKLTKGLTMFIISIVALIVNDTGVVAFVYMNAYLIGLMIESDYS
ncbi:hypothetical protein Curi_c06320 [Gottschalkia acidurici 9a]|uniref:Transmembrane protein n=1 Tax=Gottschalkia acidurici (strain ATCC 7906 / DSM 604 / BCRC 14475 / CIP 104303 / KCTC 5404 / NCIMB 10678 / 9a) TaxID=1128398 RepID=K0AY69_GOTA9|nr:hypothetical protein [Gottschalkia acidurici]AFS77705.1 hypothetical protein Curi_c06320 [Gottschalkia acidurici 9a]